MPLFNYSSRDSVKVRNNARVLDRHQSRFNRYIGVEMFRKTRKDEKPVMKCCKRQRTVCTVQHRFSTTTNFEFWPFFQVNLGQPVSPWALHLFWKKTSGD